MDKVVMFIFGIIVVFVSDCLAYTEIARMVSSKDDSTCLIGIGATLALMIINYFVLRGIYYICLVNKGK